MITTTNTIKLSGADGIPVLVECSVEPGIGIHLVGLADAAVKESLLRTVTALQANGYRIPGKKIVINLAPTDLYKSGCGYDLPIALALIAASDQDEGKLKELGRWFVVGELGLDGSVRDVPGCIQAVGAAILTGCKGVVIPKGNGVEIVDLLDEKSIPVYGVASLNEAIDTVSGKATVPTVWEDPANEPTENHKAEDPAWDGITGNEAAKRALEIAAAGGHHILLAGASEGTRCKLAKALRDILPPMTKEEALSVARIWSASGKGAFRAAGTEGVRRRPFRAPHYSSSMAALLGGGGGENIRPGEVSLASGGVLFIDEYREAPKSVKEALRGPVEDKEITISRLKTKVRFPARFQLAAGTALCPCGKYGEGERCTCTAGQRAAYLQGLSGPVFDSIDIQAFIHQETTPPWMKVTPPEGNDAASVSERVAKAREIQNQRFGDGRLNADMKTADISRHCALGDDEAELIETLITRLGLSARSYNRILKIARTIADLDGREAIGISDLAEAASYRFLDRRGFGQETSEAQKSA